MIPALNFAKVQPSDRADGYRMADSASVVQADRAQLEASASTPLRSRRALSPWSRRDASTSPRGANGSNSGAPLSRRAMDVLDVVGWNATRVTDVSVLQAKVVELAERLVSLEAWYRGQIQERDEFVQHRLGQLAAASAPVEVPTASAGTTATTQARAVGPSRTASATAPLVVPVIRTHTPLRAADNHDRLRSRPHVGPAASSSQEPTTPNHTMARLKRASHSGVCAMSPASSTVCLLDDSGVSLRQTSSSYSHISDMRGRINSAPGISKVKVRRSTSAKVGKSMSGGGTSESRGTLGNSSATDDCIDSMDSSSYDRRRRRRSKPVTTSPSAPVTVPVALSVIRRSNSTTPQRATLSASRLTPSVTAK